MDIFQDPPNAVQIELVEGCCLSCNFCGVRGIRTKTNDFRFMTNGTLYRLSKMLKNVMEGNGWNPRLELAVHGEPTCHPRLVPFVEKLATLNPRELILVSNGFGLCRDVSVIDVLFNMGLSSICLDEYKGCKFVDTIRKKYKGSVPIVEYGDGTDSKFRGRVNNAIVVKGDMRTLSKPWDRINTHCGCGVKPPNPNPSINKRCAKPFRELTVRWDGNVSLCCNDFRGIYKVGNIRDYQSLHELWNSLAFDAGRKMLYAGIRDFVPCKWCDALSTRVGLLPDKRGKQSMGNVTFETLDVISNAIAGKCYTTPILRPWEGKIPCLPNTSAKEKPRQKTGLSR